MSRHAGSREQGAGGAWPLPPLPAEPGKIALNFGVVTVKFADRAGAERFLTAVRNRGSLPPETLSAMERELNAGPGGVR